MYLVQQCHARQARALLCWAHTASALSLAIASNRMGSNRVEWNRMELEEIERNRMGGERVASRRITSDRIPYLRTEAARHQQELTPASGPTSWPLREAVGLFSPSNTIDWLSRQPPAHWLSVGLGPNHSSARRPIDSSDNDAWSPVGLPDESERASGRRAASRPLSCRPELFRPPPAGPSWSRGAPIQPDGDSHSARARSASSCEPSGWRVARIRRAPNWGGGPVATGPSRVLEWLKIAE